MALPGVPGDGTDFVPRTGQLMEAMEGDDKLVVRFYEYMTPEGAEDHIEITIPGDLTSKPDRVVTDMDKVRFAKAWNAYRGNDDQFAGQTRIDTMAWIDIAMQWNLKRVNIYTVEGLAGLPDSAINAVQIAGLSNLRTRAQEFLSEKKDTAQNDKLRSELETLRAEFAAMRSKPKRKASATA